MTKPKKRKAPQWRSEAGSEDAIFGENPRAKFGQRWQYKIVERGTVSSSSEALDKLGNERWELVAVVGAARDSSHCLYFKRRAP